MSSFLQRFFGRNSFRHLFVQQPEFQSYDDQIRVYTVDKPLVEDASQIWKTSKDGGIQNFLRDFENAILPFTEITIFLGHDALYGLPDINAWYRACVQHVSTKLSHFSTQQKIQKRFLDHPIGIQFWLNGQHDLHLKLNPDEFAIGFLRNQHKKRQSSKELIKILGYIPDKWDKFKKIGVLFNDQVQFSIGNFALDNFTHESLLVPSLYRLFVDESGQVLHQLNEQVEAKVRISTIKKENRPDTIVLHVDNRPIIHLILELMEVNRRTDPNQHSIDITTKTVSPMQKSCCIQQRGVLLQKIHFHKWMESYSVFLCRDGSIKSTSQQSIGEIKVSQEQVQFIPLRAPTFVNNKLVAKEETVLLTGNATINCAGKLFQFEDLRHITNKDWPYVGELHSESDMEQFGFGATYKIGRSEACDIRLSNHNHNENIGWHPKVREGDSLPSKKGKMSKKQFSTDAIMVAKFHAELDLTRDAVFRNVSSGCLCFVRRGGEFIELLPKNKSGAVPLATDDHLLVGNGVYQVTLSESPIWELAEHLIKNAGVFSGEAG